MTTHRAQGAGGAVGNLTENTRTLTLLQMSMIWNTDPVGHCLVFPSLQITKSTVVFYLVASELAPDFLPLKDRSLDQTDH